MTKASRTILSKIKSPQALKRALSGLRTSRGGKSERIVFTNGCFDILHKGHVAYLQQARGAGTRLVVALNSDASVKRLKGKLRPVNELADRLEVVAALESVDYVTWFKADDPVSLIKSLKPDVLVKGGDWKPHQILGSADVQSWGGKVRSLKFIEGRSTTAIIKRAGLSRIKR